MTEQNQNIPADGFNAAPQSSEENSAANAPAAATPPAGYSYRTSVSRSERMLLPGVVLIVIGIIFLLQNTTGFRLHNWWALFILIPAFSALGAAYRMYKDQHALTPAARGSLVSGLILTLVAAVFLLGLSWGILWPLVLVLVGLGILLGNLR